MTRFIIFLIIWTIFQLNAKGQPYADIFFSEYVEGYGNNRALEIYNPTDRTINLSQYQITRYPDGKSQVNKQYTTVLQGELPPKETFVLVNGQQTGSEQSPACDDELQGLADMLDNPYPAPTYMDGNDAIVLEKTDGTQVDIIGKMGEDPGSGWYDQDSTNYQALGYDELAWTKNHTLIRKPIVNEGMPYNYGDNAEIPQFFNPANQWDSLPAGTWHNLGEHNITPLGLQTAYRDANDMTIYPNPAPYSSFRIRAKKPVRQVEILTLVGQSVYKKNKAQPSRVVQINLTQARDGIYLVKTRFKDGTFTVSKVLLSNRR